VDALVAQTETLLGTYLQGRLTRGELLKTAAAAGIVAAVLPTAADAAGASGAPPAAMSFPFFPPTTSGSYTPESVTEIVSNILTWDYLEATATTVLVTNAAIQTAIGQTPFTLNFLQSFLAAVQAHIDFWGALVPTAQPVTMTFTIDPALLSSPSAALAIYDLASGTRVAMMITAVREFAELGQPVLAKYAAQHLAMYGEDHGTVRALEVQAGAPGPVINKAFETEVFLHTSEAVDVIRGLGLIGGKGLSLTYPGRDTVLAAAGATGAAVTQLRPNSVNAPFVFTGPASVLAPKS